MNDNPTILNSDTDGRHEHHNAFGSGSNRIEFKTGDGKSAPQAQLYGVKLNRLSPQLCVICSWDAPEVEVDLHIITPDGQRVF